MTTSNTDDQLLRDEDVARKLNVTRRWVRRAIQDGRLKKTKVGKYVRIHPDDLADFIVKAREAGER